jgi:hypothetical protein
MKPLRSRPPAVSALAVSVLAVSVLAVTAWGATLLAAPGPSYAASRPRTHDEYVAHTTAVPDSTTFPTKDLVVGHLPSIPYAFASKPSFGDGNWRLLRPDGTSLTLPRLTWSAWAPMGDGAIGMAGTEAGPELQQVSATGELRSRMVRHFGLEVSPDHEIVGWLGDHGRPHVVEGAGTGRFVMPQVPHGTSIAAIWGEETCQEQAPEGGGCTVFVHRKRHVWLSTSHGIVSRIGPMLRVADVNERGRVIGLVSRRTADGPDCWGVYRPGGHRAFRTCDYYLDAFSPDGRRVLAERSRIGSWSVRRFAILGHDGHVVHAWTFDSGARRSLSQLTWEDDHHLLGVLLAHGTWGVVRISTDGTVEYAGPTVEATDEFTPFDLPVR